MTPKWKEILKAETFIPIGEYKGRKIALLHGKPYYTSKAESYTEGKGYKNKGQWYGFGGLEPDASKWNKKWSGEWWIKGKHPDIPKHAHMESFEPTIYSQSAKMKEEQYDGEWPKLSNAQDVNELLAANGFEPKIKGQYPTLVG